MRGGSGRVRECREAARQRPWEADLKPHSYRTKDGGRTWVEIVSGIPDNEVVNAMREDPQAGGAGGAAPQSNLTRVSAELGALYRVVEGYDGTPATQAVRGVVAAERTLADLLGRWDGLKREGAGLEVQGR